MLPSRSRRAFVVCVAAVIWMLAGTAGEAWASGQGAVGFVQYFAAVLVVVLACVVVLQLGVGLLVLPKEQRRTLVAFIVASPFATWLVSKLPLVSGFAVLVLFVPLSVALARAGRGRLGIFLFFALVAFAFGFGKLEMWALDTSRLFVFGAQVVPALPLAAALFAARKPLAGLLVAPLFSGALMLLAHFLSP